MTVVRIIKEKDKDSTLIQDLESLADPYTRGDPMSPLRRTCKSLSNLTEELVSEGHKVSRSKVCEILHELDYSLKSDRKTKKGEDHPDRDGQFMYISEKVRHLSLICIERDKFHGEWNYCIKPSK